MLLNLLVQTRQYFFENWKQIFAHENKQVPTKVAFLTAQVENSSIANQPQPAPTSPNQPKTSPNPIFCSISMAHRAPSI